MGAAVQTDTAELDALRETDRDVCERAGGYAPARREKTDTATWQILAREIGLAGLGMADEVGGVGGLAEILVVSDELGRHLTPVPFLSSTVLAGQVLSACGSEHAAAVAEGTALGTVVLADADGCWRPDRVDVRAEDESLSGTAYFVLDGLTADVLVVATPTGTFTVDAEAEGVRRSAMRTLDLARPQAVVEFDGAAATRIADDTAAVDAAVDVGLLANAAGQFGGAQTCLDMTVGYLKERKQFGRPIGSFQANKHRAADMLLQVETARSAITRALDAAEIAEAAAVAKVWCSDAYRFVSAETVQLHGGMGFTWEHDAQLHYRRARADAVLLGDPAFYRERLAALLAW